ncbi:hypothetical protein [Actinophytocola sp.]|nr:hypothetical protein [Actinophytocola sp.]
MSANAPRRRPGDIDVAEITPEICAAEPALILVHNLINGTPLDQALVRG